ncbi:restriction endonuclease subunit S [Listeria booriae]|uniref:restriction endonuclease subunit S n=1 Tax=Listeria booriae TaxID=1552123 RepID=UPI001629734D|nr:restriction endonuclease subunit S [Listeria booriae]MBC1574329.1 restriction endonuclease subunit S [Listeria booriae]
MALQAWEQRKLGEDSDVRDGTHDSPKYFHTGHPLVTSKNLKDFGLDLSDISFISNEDFESINKRSKVHVGDILFGMIGTIGNPVQLTREDFAIKNVALIKEKQNILNIFLIQLLKSAVFDRYIRNENTGGTQKFLSLSKIRDFHFFCPSLKEQNEISSFFKHLDNTIALHQRKLDTLKQMKKGFLQQLFPESGEKLPRVRFTGFQEEWEQREFGDVLIFSVPNNNFPRASLNYEEGIIKNIHYGDVLMKFDSVVDVSTSNIPFVTNGQLESFTNQFLQNGDIVIADTAEDKITGKAIEVCGINNTSVVSGLHTMVARPNISFASRYLGYYLNSYSYRKQLLPLMQGIKVLSISKSNISKTTLCFPKNAIEQERIGDFFKQLDKTMLLHQNRLTKLTTLKKAYLKIMFI